MLYGFHLSKIRFVSKLFLRTVNLKVYYVYIYSQNTVSGTDVIDFKNVKIEYGLLKDFQDLLDAAKTMGTVQYISSI